MVDKEQKVLLFWCEDQQWSIVNVSAVKGETKLGVRTQGKFQGKWYPAILVAKDFPEALKQKEEDFKGFLNNCLQEEAPEDIENCVLQYIQDKHEMVASDGTDAVEPLAKRVKLTMQAKPLKEYAHQIHVQPAPETGGNDEESLPLQKPVDKKPDVLEKQGTVRARNSENLQRTVDELQGTVKKLKDRIKKLEKWQITVQGSKQEPYTVQGSKQEPSTSTSVPRAPESPTTNPGDSSLFNGKSYEWLQDSVNFSDDLYSAVATLLSHLFSDDYILTHSVTGQRGNSALMAKPKFDSRLYNAMVSIIRNKFPSVSKSEITQKVQSVQKKIKRKI